MKYILLLIPIFLISSCTTSPAIIRTDKVTSVTPGCDMFVTYQECDYINYDMCPPNNLRPIYTTVCENKVTTSTDHEESCGKNCHKTISDVVETAKK